MVQDITGFGAVVNIIATSTFPVGLPITQFADDSDPIDIANVQIADTAMGLNGDLLKWARAVPLPVVLNVVPGSIDDENLQILANANRVGQGKVSAYDQITLTVVYADGTSVTFTGGAIIDANFGKAISSAGRLKSRSYAFAFEQRV